jgi:nitroreductase
MITELLRNRFSVRKFQDKPIPDDVVKDMLEAGRLSPSGGNEQPWAFGVVTGMDCESPALDCTVHGECK